MPFYSSYILPTHGDYTIEYCCLNCTHRFTVTIPVGTLAPREGVICPNCGCDTTQKSLIQKKVML